MAELLYLGGVAFALALLVGFLLGTTTRRVVLAVAIGPAILAAWVAVALIADGPCHHCGDYFGRSVDPIVFRLAWANALAWLVGAVAGAVVRAAVRPSGSRSA